MVALCCTPGSRIPSAYTGLFSVCRRARGHGQAVMPAFSRAPIVEVIYRAMPMLEVERELFIKWLSVFIADALSFPDWGLLALWPGLAGTTFEPFLPFILFIRCVLSSMVAALRHAGYRMNHTGFFFFLDPLVDFFAMNGDFFGRSNADSDLIPFDAKHGDLNVVADIQRLTDPSG